MISLDSHQMSWITIAFFQYITYEKSHEKFQHDIPKKCLVFPVSPIDIPIESHLIYIAITYPLII